MGKDLIVESNQVKLRDQVLVAAGNRRLCRGNVVSCVYARPFDRMPVEVTHLHSSLEGGSPTEVESSPYLRSALGCFF